MKGKKLYIVFAGIVGILLVSIMWNSFTQPGVQDLEGDFKRVAFYRNENNTGPVERVYAVTVADTLWGEMEKYGAYMPHNKYGNTRVDFFLEGTPVPSTLSPGPENLEKEFQEYVLARYEKDAMGRVSFIKSPGNIK